MKTAIILNFTGNYYHYGCFGTAYEIYYRLLESGYFVNYISVKATHNLECYPQTGEQFLDSSFAQQFGRANVSLITALQEADIVVVNGEGTLHHLSKGSMTLLYLIYLAHKVMHKEVYLINHSCYPMGDTSRGDLDLVYQIALSGLRDIVVREPLSALFYQAYSIDARIGFDSLPLFIGRHDMLDLRSKDIDQNKIILCGGIAYNAKSVPIISRLLKELDPQYRIEFLVGGKADLAPEDNDVLFQFQQEGLYIERNEAKCFEDWCKSIASARFIISGRFHYTIAAMSLAVPCISFPSNTPKTEGIYQMFGLDGYVRWEAEDFSDKLQVLLNRASENELILGENQRLELIEKAENNFSGISQGH